MEYFFNTPGPQLLLPQAQNGTVETETGVAQVRITRLLQFEIVTGGIEVCHAVWQGRETQRCIAGSDNLQGILAIFYWSVRYTNSPRGCRCPADGDSG